MAETETAHATSPGWGSRCSAALRSVQLLLYAAILSLAVVLPLYPDELEWKLINSRLFLDGGMLIYLWPACRESFLLKPPITWLPSRVLDALLYANMSEPIKLRVFAILLHVLTILLVAAFVRRLFEGLTWPRALSAVVGATTLGVLPFLLILNRQEQMLILTVLVACALPFVRLPPWTSNWKYRNAWLCAFLCLLVCHLTATHPTGLYLLFPVLVACFLSLRTHRSRALVLALAIVSSVQTFQMWRARTSCVESPFLTRVFNNLTLAPADILFRTRSFLTAGIENLRNLTTYIGNVKLQPAYQSGWLTEATMPVGWPDEVANLALSIPVAVAVLAAALGVVLFTYRALFRRTLDARLSVSLALTASVTMTAFFQTTKNFYSSGLLFPLLGLAALLAAASLERTTWARRVARTVLVACLFVSLITEIVLLYRFVPIGNSRWLPHLETERRSRAQISELVRDCQLSESVGNLVLDHPAYSILWRRAHPVIVSYVHGWWATDLDWRKSMEAQDNHGAVARCSSLPKEISDASLKRDGFCCYRPR